MYIACESTLCKLYGRFYRYAKLILFQQKGLRRQLLESSLLCFLDMVKYSKYSSSNQPCRWLFVKARHLFEFLLFVSQQVVLAALRNTETKKAWYSFHTCFCGGCLPHLHFFGSVSVANQATIPPPSISSPDSTAFQNIKYK